MNSDEIVHILNRDCANLFIGVYARDTLPAKLPPKRPILLVCNTDPHYKAGEHWICMYFDETGTAEYFCSLGQEPMPIFERYLTKNSKLFVWNDIKLQSIVSAYCGNYAVFYAIFKNKGYSMEDIINCFTTDTTLNDIIAHKFVCTNKT